VNQNQNQNQNGIAALQTNGYFAFLTHFVDLQDAGEDRGNSPLRIDRPGRVLCGTICGPSTWRILGRYQTLLQSLSGLVSRLAKTLFGIGDF